MIDDGAIRKFRALLKGGARLTPEMRRRIARTLQDLQGSGYGRLRAVLEDIEGQLSQEEELVGFRASMAKASDKRTSESFEKILGKSHFILKDPSYLQPLSDPPRMRIGAREYALRILRTQIAESVRSKIGRTIFLFGPPGAGKTVCVKRILQELRDHFTKDGADGYAIYVNAGQTRSPYYTLLEIVRAIGVDAPSSGWQFTRLKQEFERVKDERPTAIAIDEADTLLPKEREPLVYYLNRQPFVTLILISNRFRDLSALPERARSSLQPIPLIFRPYSAQDAHAILADRVRHAFRPKAVPEAVLREVAGMVANVGDIRFGFNLLLTTAINAEASGKKRIQLEDVRSVAAGLDESLRG